MRKSSDPKEIIYMRFFQGRKIYRVTKIDTLEESFLSWYPSENPEIFNTESFNENKGNPLRGEIKREGIPDEILLRLLSGESREDILEDYKMYKEDSYLYCKKTTSKSKITNHRLFRIAKDNDEDEILARREKFRDKSSVS